jgi:hypothetical protein
MEAVADWSEMDGPASKVAPSSLSMSGRTIVLVLAVALLVASYTYLRTVTSQSGVRAHIDEIFRPLSPPPPRLVVCTDSMDAACAQRAADRIGTTVAWLDEPPGYELEWMLANDRTVSPADGVIATQYFLGADGHGMFEVVTSVPPLGDPPTPRSRAIFNGTDHGKMWVDEQFGVVSIGWAHDGVEYLITAQPRPWDPLTVEQAWKTVRYASPKTSS